MAAAEEYHPGGDDFFSMIREQGLCKPQIDLFGALGTPRSISNCQQVEQHTFASGQMEGVDLDWPSPKMKPVLKKVVLLVLYRAWRRSLGEKKHLALLSTRSFLKAIV
ncbi:jg16338 [Pararge aegeria aegeria]|uniref:Jg16338 protein n=1 Tax=Pararge aegeria aegeria TaxID=348720 RepID=A0A8S4RTL6_9NEOP|nr:jg16338 [Pararge aegeria aegeria]